MSHVTMGSPRYVRLPAAVPSERPPVLASDPSEIPEKWMQVSTRLDVVQILKDTNISTTNPRFSTLHALILHFFTLKGVCGVEVGGSFPSAHEFKDPLADEREFQTSFADVDIVVCMGRAKFSAKEEAENFSRDHIKPFLDRNGLEVFRLHGGGLDPVKCSDKAFAVKFRLADSRMPGKRVDVLVVNAEHKNSKALSPDSSRSTIVWRCIPNPGEPGDMDLGVASLFPIAVLRKFHTHGIRVWIERAQGLLKRIAVGANKVTHGAPVLCVVQAELIKKWALAICEQKEARYSIVQEFPDVLGKTEIFDLPPDKLQGVLLAAHPPTRVTREVLLDGLSAPDAAVMRELVCEMESLWSAAAAAPPAPATTKAALGVQIPPAAVPEPAPVSARAEAVSIDATAEAPRIVAAPAPAAKPKKAAAAAVEKEERKAAAAAAQVAAAAAKEERKVAAAAQVAAAAAKEERKVAAAAAAERRAAEERKATAVAERRAAAAAAAEAVVAAPTFSLESLHKILRAKKAKPADVMNAWSAIADAFFRGLIAAASIQEILNVFVEWEERSSKEKTVRVAARLCMAFERFSADRNTVAFASFAREFCEHAVASQLTDEQMRRVAPCLLRVSTSSSGEELAWVLRYKTGVVKALPAGSPDPTNALSDEVFLAILEHDKLADTVAKHVVGRCLVPRFSAKTGHDAFSSEDVALILAMLNHVVGVQKRFPWLQRILANSSTAEAEKVSVARAVFDEFNAKETFEAKLKFEKGSLELTCFNAALPFFHKAFQKQHAHLFSHKLFCELLLGAISRSTDLPEVTSFLAAIAVAAKLPDAICQKILAALENAEHRAVFLELFRIALSEFDTEAVSLNFFSNQSLIVCLKLLVMYYSSREGALSGDSTEVVKAIEEVMELVTFARARLCGNKMELGKTIPAQIKLVFTASSAALDAVMASKIQRRFFSRNLPRLLARAAESVGGGINPLEVVKEVMPAYVDAVSYGSSESHLTEGRLFFRKYADTQAELDIFMKDILLICQPYFSSQIKSLPRETFEVFVDVLFITACFGENPKAQQRMVHFAHFANTPEFRELGLHVRMVRTFSVYFSKKEPELKSDGFLFNMLVAAFPEDELPPELRKLEERLEAHSAATDIGCYRMMKLSMRTSVAVATAASAAYRAAKVEKVATELTGEVAVAEEEMKKLNAVRAAFEAVTRRPGITQPEAIAAAEQFRAAGHRAKEVCLSWGLKEGDLEEINATIQLAEKMYNFLLQWEGH